MNEMDWQNENYLTMLSDMEQSWQQAIVKAITAREDHRTTSHTVITGLLQQMKEKDLLEKRREEEISSLKATVNDLNMRLDKANSEITNLLETKQRQQEDKTGELRQELLIRNKEIEDLKSQHAKSILELTSGTKQTLLDLENQLETITAKEEHCRKKICELQEVNKKNETKLQDWNRVSKQMCNEVSDVKNKLQGSRYANAKLKEEIGLWKKYCDKVEGERKAIRREVELENRVLKKFDRIETHLKSERTHRNLTLDAMNQFGHKLIHDLKQLRCNKETTVKLSSVESQTENREEETENRRKLEQLEFLESRELQLEENLKKCKLDLENLRQQNLTLREVIRAMKQEREHWEKEKEHIEEVRVTKLEESVRLLRNNLMNEEKEVCVWNALQDVKKEVSSLKNKNMIKPITNKETEVKKIDVPGFKFGVPKGFKK